jgi:hypothetical protein
MKACPWDPKVLFVVFVRFHDGRFRIVDPGNGRFIRLVGIRETRFRPPQAILADLLFPPPGEISHGRGL